MKKLSFLLSGCLLIAVTAFSQDQDKPMFVVHEDIVNPQMNAEYMQAMEGLKKACVDNQIELNWTTLWFNDNSVVNVMPVSGVGDIMENPFSDLVAKIGEEEFGKIMGKFNGTFHSHNNTVIAMEQDLSYMEAPPSAEENYRDITFWNPLPMKGAEARELFMKWKEMSAANASPNHYAVYSVVIGDDLPGYAIVNWGKSELDLAQKRAKSQEMEGEKMQELWNMTLKITDRMTSKRGWVMQNTSYNYTAANNEEE